MEASLPDRPLAGRYSLQEPIADGGMATVWLARDDVLIRPVAVKVLHQDLAADPVFLERFRREAVSAAALAHPCVIRVFDTGVDGGVCFIVLEHFESETLETVMSRTGPLETERAAGLMLPVLSALRAAHECGVVHRDVKPANILVDAEGRVKVMDFGIARATENGHDLTRTGAVLGTVRYLSPEQVEGLPVDPRSDLYSAGVVLYEMLTGRVPFDGDTDVATAMMRLTSEPSRPRDLRAGIPRGMESVVLKAMARRPDDRFASAAAMADALHRTAGSAEPTLPRGIPPVDVPVPGEQPARPSMFRSWMLVPLTVVLLAVGVIVAGLAVGRLRLGGPLGVRPAPQRTPATSRVDSPAPIAVTQAKDFDPQGNDHAENPQSVPLAFDGNPDTAWVTGHYASPAFGGLKDGVGLWVGFGGTKRLAQVTIQSTIPGWTFELMAADGVPAELGSPLTAANGATQFTVDAAGKAEIALRPVSFRGLLVWITGLGPSAGRYGYAASIAEISVSGAPG